METQCSLPALYEMGFIWEYQIGSTQYGERLLKVLTRTNLCWLWKLWNNSHSKTCSTSNSNRLTTGLVLTECPLKKREVDINLVVFNINTDPEH